MIILSVAIDHGMISLNVISHFIHNKHSKKNFTKSKFQDNFFYYQSIISSNHAMKLVISILDKYFKKYLLKSKLQLQETFY